MLVYFKVFEKLKIVFFFVNIGLLLKKLLVNVIKKKLLIKVDPVCMFLIDMCTFET